MSADQRLDSEVQGLDFEWLATDSIGHIALLTTAGFGPVPLAVFGSEPQYYLCADYFEHLPSRGEIVQHSPCAGVSSWIKAARQGLYVYDYSGETGEFGSYIPGKPYRRIASPCHPLVLPELPLDIQLYLKPIQFKSIDFSLSHELHPDLEFAEVNV